MRYFWQWFASWPILSGMLGVVLLAAVALKGHEIATEELLENSLLTSRWFLIVVVEWEIFFALWLLGGFYRFYPRTTQWVALLYFFALFVVAVDSVLKGKPSCDCFGKAIVPPWIVAGFDLAALFLLAIVPVPPVSHEAGQRARWLGLTGVFSVFGLLSLTTMLDYSTSGAIPSIRRNPRLFGVVSKHGVRPSTEEILVFLRDATGLNMTADERLPSGQPTHAIWDLKNVQPWLVMEMLVHQQTVPTRWEKVDGDYALVTAAPFGKSRLFWFGGAALLALAMLGLRWPDLVKDRKKALSGDTYGEANVRCRFAWGKVSLTTCRFYLEDRTMWKRSLFIVAICTSLFLGICGAERLLAFGPGWGYYCTSGTPTTCPFGQCNYKFGVCTTCGTAGALCNKPGNCSFCQFNAITPCCLNNNTCPGWDIANGVGCNCDADDLPPNGTVFFCQRPPSVWTLFASQ